MLGRRHYYIISLSPLKKFWRIVFVSLFGRWKNWSSERGSHLPKITRELAELGLESRCLIPKVVPLSSKQKLETVHGCALERTPVYRRQERNKGREVPPWHCTILICLDPDWKLHWAQPVATPAAFLSHFGGGGGPLGYAIFLSDILGIFYESFLQRELFNSFPEEECLLP